MKGKRHPCETRDRANREASGRLFNAKVMERALPIFYPLKTLLTPVLSTLGTIQEVQTQIGIAQAQMNAKKATAYGQHCHYWETDLKTHCLNNREDH